MIFIVALIKTIAYHLKKMALDGIKWLLLSFQLTHSIVSLFLVWDFQTHTLRLKTLSFFARSTFLFTTWTTNLISFADILKLHLGILKDYSKDDGEGLRIHSP